PCSVGSDRLPAPAGNHRPPRSAAKAHGLPPPPHRRMILPFPSVALKRTSEVSVSLKTQLLLFFAAVACMAAAMGVHDSVFNNFLNDTFQLTADQRGWLEFPRELPGFLTVLMTGVLASLAVTRLAVVASAMFLGGLVGIALLGASYPMMVTMMMIASAGMHLLQPVGGSIALGLSEASNRGR